MATQVTITIPDFKGYRTLVINSAAALLGIAAVIWPHAVLPSPEAIGLGYDQLAGALAAILGVINTVLRFLTATPPAINPLGVEPNITAGDLNNAYANGRRDVVLEARAKRDNDRLNAQMAAQQALQDPYANTHLTGLSNADSLSEIAPGPSSSPASSVALFALTFAASALCSLPVWVIGLKALA